MVSTMCSYLVPSCMLAMPTMANYRQVMGPRREPCGTNVAYGTTILLGSKMVLPICSQLLVKELPLGSTEHMLHCTGRRARK